ncbi:MAG: DUF2628 domain-containing protein [Campylobacterota bacterium]|nr:DUF2628 domain-containing protein [Campylobacterota bacterium]
MHIDSNDIDQLIQAHVQKPEKVYVYKAGVQGNTVNDQLAFKATWSWWAFLGGWAFFLYRKMYLQAAIFFVLSLCTTIIPFGWIILSIASGMSAFYFYAQKFQKDLLIAQYGQKPIEDVNQTLQYLGGYHSWVTVVAIIYYGFIALFAVPVLLATLAIN